LIRAVPTPKPKWKLPVKQWIHELHFNSIQAFRQNAGRDTSGPYSRRQRQQPGGLGIRDALGIGDEGVPSEVCGMSFRPIKLRDYVRMHLKASYFPACWSLYITASTALPSMDI
jgi:hypothetical protein